MQNGFVHNITFTEFKLIGFNALGEWRPFLFIPYLLMLLLAITANSTLLYIIVSNRTLHSPMFIMIGLMAVVDLCGPMLFVPQMLLNVLFGWNGISLLNCLIQMLLIHYSETSQCTLLLCMALDRYFAICRPLLYHKYMEISNVFKFITLPLFRNAVLIATIVCLAGRLSYCTNVIDHCFCEHMALVQLACGDISVNSLVGISSAFLSLVLDVILITISYIIIFISVFRSGKVNWKALNTCITHIIVIIFTIVFALMAFLSYRIRNNFSSSSRVFLSTMYVLFPSCCNPIIYGLRTKEIRQHFLKLIKPKKITPL